MKKVLSVIAQVLLLIAVAVGGLTILWLTIGSGYKTLFVTDDNPNVIERLIYTVDWPADIAPGSTRIGRAYHFPRRDHIRLHVTPTTLDGVALDPLSEAGLRVVVSLGGNDPHLQDWSDYRNVLIHSEYKLSGVPIEFPAMRLIYRNESDRDISVSSYVVITQLNFD